MSLVNICARARAAEPEVLIFPFNVLDANQLIPPPVFHFAMVCILDPLFILEWAGLLRPCNRLDSFAFFHFAEGWISPPMFVSFCNGLDSSAHILILQWAKFLRPFLFAVAVP